jgi:UDP-N-acetylmuramyl pentapeptide phosphotransferase/UDP-N-acetylglucosamine-1-phosphate transferase
MGDTGSLLLGMVSAILAIKFIEFNRLNVGNTTFSIHSAPAIAISILLIPLSDTIRVFTLRTLQGKSPFSPDRNHIHHILTDLGFCHLRSTAILILFNIFSIGFTFYFKELDGELLLAINIFFVILFSGFFSHQRRRKRRKEKLLHA